MRSFDPLFSAHLESGTTTLAWCWRIARRDGAVFGFTDHDRPLAFAGTDYEPFTGADGAALVSTADLAVDNSEIAGVLSSDHLSAADLMSGRFDGADVEIWRVDWANPAVRALIKRGSVGEITRSGARFTAELRGRAHLLDAARGRVYQKRCDAVVGDARCGVDLDIPARRGEGVVTAVLGETRFLVAGIETFSADWFAYGRIDWTSGANAGTAAEVKTSAGLSLALSRPPGAPALAGDTFTVRAGCDKSFATCGAKFSNAENFRGFPTMPGDDVAVSYPLRGENNDGGRRG